MDFTDIYRTLYPQNQRIHIQQHLESSKIDTILEHKTNLHKFRETEIISCILSYHKAIKLKIDIKQISNKYTNLRRLNNSLLNDECVKEQIKKEIRNFLN